MDENLSNMTEILSLNNVWSMKNQPFRGDNNFPRSKEIKAGILELNIYIVTCLSPMKLWDNLPKDQQIN